MMGIVLQSHGMTLKRHGGMAEPISVGYKRSVAPYGRRGGKEFPRGRRTVAAKFKWAEAISDSEWEVYRSAMVALREAGIPFMLGGGFALATFTGRWRDTKDIDFYIRPKDREKAIEALTSAGFEDYFKERAYDRKWIYRSTRSDVIVDIIWAMANQRAQVDDLWLSRAGTVVIRGEKLQVVPMEEFMWCKLYIIQRDHCDWTDIFNLLCAVGPRLAWMHLIKRLEEDTPLLKGLLSVFSWLCPRAARKLPAALWRKLRLRRAAGVPLKARRDHIRLLDSRHWFAALEPSTQKLEYNHAHRHDEPSGSGRPFRNRMDASNGLRIY